jgi:hypothetical protein
VVFGIDEADDAAEDHVDRSGVEGGGDENKDHLHDVGRQGVIGLLLDGDVSEDVANAFNCWPG